MAETRVLLTVEQAMQIHDALAHSRRHLQSRDEMNAEVHLAEEVRWSPLTELVGNAETMLGEVLQEQAIIGAPLQHQMHPLIWKIRTADG
jgi:hypothetical protein